MLVKATNGEPSAAVKNILVRRRSLPYIASQHVPLELNFCKG
jgi:hypothetical protein